MKKHWQKILFLVIICLTIFLRLYKVDELVPPYWEEAALGYDAYSISQTGHDHHGNFMPLVAFESFGDWKPSLYFYTIVPFIKLIGLNVMAVRLPSIISGIFIILGIFVLLKMILPKDSLTKKPYLPFLGMFVGAISPWAILFSRAAWEVNLATALTLWGIICFISFINETKNKYLHLTLSIILLSLSMYTYHATRIIAPLTGLGLLVLWFSQKVKTKRIGKSLKSFLQNNLLVLTLSLIFTLIILSPIIINLNNTTTSQRFSETSIFSNLDVITESNNAKQIQPNLIGKIIYHRNLLFLREIVTNYLSHFNINFLFLSGDINPRHSVQYFGQLYHIELIFLVLGVYFVFIRVTKKDQDQFDQQFNHYLLFLLFYLLIGIIPASLTKTTPHALRILPTIPIFIILITLGINQFIDESANLLSLMKIKIKSIFSVILSLIILIYLVELSAFGRFYTRVYPVQYSSQWQIGYQELIETIKDKIGEDTPIYITREYGRPAMYTWFYNKTDPKIVQQWNNIAKKDQGEYLEFENIKFVNSLNEITDTKAIVAGSKEQVDNLVDDKQNFTMIKEIKDLNGKIIWEVGQLQ